MFTICAVVLILLGVVVLQVQSMSIMGEQSSIFELPNRLDAEELLDNYNKFMLANMNMSMNPCEDFYEFACGNWEQSAIVPPQSRNDSFLHAINYAMNIMITKFLTNITEHELKEQTAESKAKLFYRSCTTMTEEMDKGYKSVLEMSEFHNRSDYEDWIDINFMSSNEMFSLLPLKTNYNADNRKVELMLMPPRVVLGNVELVNVQNLTEDFKIHDPAIKAQFMQKFKNIVSFEANLTSRISLRAPNETERVNLNEFLLRHKYDKLNWTRFFNVAFNGMQQGDWIIQNTVKDTNKLAHFLNKSSVTILRDYIQWRTLIKFYYVWKAVGTNKTLTEHCREQTEQYFSYALVPWLIDTVYDADRRADILQIAGNIKQVFYNFIDKHKWLDEDTRSHAKTKLKSMDVQAGYTDELSHRQYMNEAYKDLNVNLDWFSNIQAVEKNRAEIKKKSINQALIPPPLLIKSANAYYANFLNEAFVAIGTSQYPFYHKNFPSALKYGGIGHIIGHEIAHAFDSLCYQFNYDGKVRNWWTESSLRNFRERYRCLESQYNKFVYHGVATNGTLTLGDNIADNVGTRLAFYAYLQTTSLREIEARPLPGNRFNSRQLFFLRFAQTWCTGQDTNTKLQRMKTDVHAYEKFRVIGTLRNMPEFSEAFQCKLGSSMNPLKKCIVW